MKFIGKTLDFCYYLLKILILLGACCKWYCGQLGQMRAHPNAKITIVPYSDDFRPSHNDIYAKNNFRMFGAKRKLIILHNIS